MESNKTGTEEMHEIGSARELKKPEIPPIVSDGRAGSRVSAEEITKNAGPKSELVEVSAKSEPKAANKGKQRQLVQINRQMLLEIENLSLKLKLVSSEMRLAEVALADAKRRQEELKKAEQELLTEVGHQLGFPINSTLRLVDKERGICEVS